MGNVHSNSYCNISATAAVDGADGLFFDGQTSNPDTVQLTMRETRYGSPRKCFAHDADFFTKSIDMAPLNRRA
jgi:hypothetical protein